MITIKHPVCCIVGAGPCGEIRFRPQTGDYVIAADGGLKHLEKAGIHADMVVGDFDTLGYEPEHENVVRLQVMKDWTALEDVSLDGNPITAVPDWLVAMPRLRAVSLNDTRVTRLPADLSEWKDLDMLSLGSCPISKEEMKRIRKALPDVAIVF